VTEGSRCLEVGGGGGSIAEWMTRRVGSSGRVVATDLDTRFLESIDATNLEVLRHDIVRDPPVQGPFDIVHSRAMLAHLQDPLQAVRNMSASIAPGGWILIEDVDFITVWSVDPSSGLGRALSAIDRMMVAAGIDGECGRKLTRYLKNNGFMDIGGDGRVRVVDGSVPGFKVRQLTVETLGHRAVEGGLLSEQDFDEAMRLASDPEYENLSPIMFSAWGRKPG